MEFYFSEKLSISEYLGVHLIQDHIGTNFKSAWDDYDYVIKFQVYYVSAKEKRELGNIRLLVNKYDDTSIYLREKGNKQEEKIYNITGILNNNIAVSLPLEIGYYSKLNKTFSPEDVSLILESLCDASFNYQNIKKYQEWPGYSGSLLREGSKSEALLRKGAHIARGRYNPTKEFEVILENIAPTFEDIILYFNSKRELGRTNINLLIGENGVGKTFILNWLCETVTGLKHNIREWPYFHKLIVIAYSPFETFLTEPELLEKIDNKYEGESKRKKQASQLNRRKLNINEYAYVGFRNEEGTFDLEWPRIHSVDSIIKILEYDLENSWWVEDTHLKILKTTLAKSISFDTLALKNKAGELIDITPITKSKLKTLKEEVNKVEGIIFLKDGEPLTLSSGQKIYSYMLPAIVAEIEDESLLVIDEPELYLHPSLEIGLINMLKHLLEETNSYAVIATHSAVIAREVEQRSVSVLRRRQQVTECSNPSIETYGESLELIMGEVFDDFETQKPYQTVLDELIEKDAEIIPKHGEKLGDEALSYILAKKSSDDFEFEDEK